MTDEPIDIIIQDKISPRVAEKIRAIAQAARDGDSAVKRLQASLATINTAGVDKLAAATARVTNSQARQTAANARLISANAKLDATNAKVALSQQKLATATAQTAAAQSKAAAASTQASTATIRQQSAAATLAAQQQRVTAATSAATTAQQLNNRVRQQGNAMSRQSLQQTQNLVFQLNDIVVGLASGQKPLTVLIQQGSQISTIFGPGKGVMGTFRALGAALATIFVPLLPFIAVLATITAGIAILNHEIDKTTKLNIKFGDTFKAVFQTAYAGIKNLLGPAIKAVSPIFSSVYEAILVGAKATINGLVGLFVFAFRAIKAIFFGLPNALGDIFILAYNVVLTSTEKLINKLGDAINSVIQIANDAAAELGVDKKLDLVPKIDLQRFTVEAHGTIDLIKEIAKAGKDSFGVDYAGKAFDAIREQAIKNARKRLEEENKKNKKPTFEGIVREFELEIAGLRAVGLERERILAIGKAEEKLSRDLTLAEKVRLSGLVDTVEMLKLVNEINQPIIDLQSQLPLLNKAYADGLITLDQYTKRTLDLRIQVLELRNDLDGGLKAGLLRVQQQFGGVADVAGNLVVNAFQSAEDALVDFVRTGKVNFSSLIDGMISDLARLAIRQNITAPLANMFGLAGAGSGSLGNQFLSALPSFDVGSSRVPRDMIARVHEDEIIIPASQSRSIRAGQSSLGGGAVTVVNNMGDIIVQGASGVNSGAQAARIAQAVQVQLEQSMAKFTRQQQKIGGMLNNGNVVA